MNRLLGVIAIALGLHACTGADASVPLAAEAKAAATAEWMVHGLRSGALRTACGSSPGASPKMLAHVNARQSLSCRDLGFMLRRLPRERTWIVIPAADTAAVCAFLARERIPAPAFSHAGASGYVRESPTLTVAGLADSATVSAVYHGAQGAALLKQIPPEH